MNTRTRTRTRMVIGIGAVVLGLVVILVVGLFVGGPTLINAIAYGRTEARYSHGADLHADEPGLADWIPADADDVLVVSSVRDADTHTVLFRTTEPPDASCTPVPRMSAPTLPLEDAFDIYAIDSVLVCNGWAVAQQDAMWVAWRSISEVSPTSR